MELGRVVFWLSLVLLVLWLMYLAFVIGQYLGTVVVVERGIVYA